jgi:hypothetical protein
MVKHSGAKDLFRLYKSKNSLEQTVPDENSLFGQNSFFEHNSSSHKPLVRKLLIEQNSFAQNSSSRKSKLLFQKYSCSDKTFVRSKLSFDQNSRSSKNLFRTKLLFEQNSRSSKTLVRAKLSFEQKSFSYKTLVRTKLAVIVNSSESCKRWFHAVHACPPFYVQFLFSLKNKKKERKEKLLVAVLTLKMVSCLPGSFS